MTESDLIGGRLHMYETDGYRNFMVESIVKTCAEYYLRFSESINIKNGWLLCHRLISPFTADYRVRYHSIQSNNFKRISFFSIFMASLKSRIFSIVDFSFLSDIFITLFVLIKTNFEPSKYWLCVMCLFTVTNTVDFSLAILSRWMQRYKKVAAVISNRKTHKELKLCYCEYLRHNYKLGRSLSENPLGIEIRKLADIEERTRNIQTMGVWRRIIGGAARIYFNLLDSCLGKDWTSDKTVGNDALYMDCFLKDRRDYERERFGWGQ